MTLANLIVNVQANTVQLTKDVQKIHDSLNSLSSMATKAAGSLGIAFSVKEIFDFASHVTDLSAKLGISTDWVQKFELAFGPAGVSIDAVSAASIKLSNHLVGHDKATVVALQKMGVSLAALKGMAPEQQFLTVADAVGKIEDPTERAYAAMTVFGKGGAELLAGLTGHLTETTAGFEAMGLIIDEKTIASADNFGDQLWLLGKQLLGIASTVVGPLLPALSALGSILMWVGTDVIGPVFNFAIKSAMTILGLFWEGLSQLLSKIVGLGSSIPGVGDKFKAMSETLARSSADTTAYLHGLWQNVEQVGDKAAAAHPKIIGLGGATDAETAAAKAAATAATKLKEAWTEYGSVAGSVTDHLSSDTIESIKWDLARGYSQKVLAGVYMVTAAQVADIADRLHEETVAAKLAIETETKLAEAEAKHATELRKLSDQRGIDLLKLEADNYAARLAAQSAFDDEVARRTMNEFDFQKREILQHLADQKLALQQKGGDWEAAFELDTKVANDAINAIEWKKIEQSIKDTDEATQYWVDHSKAAWSKFSSALSELSNDFVQLAQISGDSWDGIAKGVGIAIKAVEGFLHLMEQATGTKAGASDNGMVTSLAALGALIIPVVGWVIALAVAFNEFVESLEEARIKTARFNDALLLSREFKTTTQFSQELSDAIYDLTERIASGGKDWEQYVEDTYKAGKETEFFLSVMRGRQWAEALKSVDIIRELGGAASLTADQIARIKVDTIPTLLTMIAQGGPLAVLAMKSLTALAQELGATTPTLDEVTASAERLGIKIEDLGTAIDQLRINEMAAQAAKDFDTLQRAGISTTVILEHLGDAAIQGFQDMATAALKSGLTIPESMKGILQGMVDMGLLVDENGDKLTDLSRFNFAKPLEKMVEDIIAALDRLIAKLGAIPPAHVAVVYDDPGMPASGGGSGPGVSVDTPGVNSFAGGTHGTFLDFGTGRRVTLHGRERVMTEREGRADSGLVGEVRGLRADLRRDRIFHRETITKAVKAAVQQRVA